MKWLVCFSFFPYLKSQRYQLEFWLDGLFIIFETVFFLIRLKLNDVRKMFADYMSLSICFEHRLGRRDKKYPNGNHSLMLHQQTYNNLSIQMPIKGMPLLILLIQMEAGWKWKYSISHHITFYFLILAKCSIIHNKTSEYKFLIYTKCNTSFFSSQFVNIKYYFRFMIIIYFQTGCWDVLRQHSIQYDFLLMQLTSEQIFYTFIFYMIIWNIQLKFWTFSWIWECCEWNTQYTLWIEKTLT